MVRLVPMESADFEPYLDQLTRNYAEGHIRTGRWAADEGLAKARGEVNGMLSAGLTTPNHFFYTILGGPNEEKVGVIWLASEPRGGFVYDLRIFDSFRRQGFAENAMRVLEQVAKEKGIQKISLHVFGDNLGARKLYVKLGYAETNVVMAKVLVP